MQPASIIITLAVLSCLFIFLAYKENKPRGTFLEFLKEIKNFFL